ncbi:GlcG/HbpS family heme-binding protein [Klebsiella pneumoniae]|uniref:GlcG/HbpS family heme-binding protein n=1 Tax=Klebsiella pneumoniae TaxID=573 RepID=UPI0007CC74CC|nr:heme-binding protein [Klebsiella pneumoniae]SAU42264.1 DhaG protein [Klebsiella pneumoniae]
MNKSQQVQTITLAAAQQMAAAVEKKATEINVAVVFSVVDRGGNTLLIQRMDEAFVSSCDISGLPVIFNEQVIGAVGVSGGTVEQDQLLAQCALDCFSAL